MQGDFSRLTFDPKKRFTRVLMQQGRVQLDADWNEQAAILLHYLETLAADLIGPHGGPADACGFKIDWAPGTPALTIGTGRYYVDGLLCENLPEAPLPPRTLDPVPELPFLVYLDVWERHITYIEDGSIREVALGGPDTATRAQVVCQVRVTGKNPKGRQFPTEADELGNWQDWVDLFQPPNRGSLKARAKPSGDPTNPGPRYRGLENKLYRVEIHRGGTAGQATFKWSRDNGSVTFPIAGLATSGTASTTATLEPIGKGQVALAPDDWVEIIDDDAALGTLAESLGSVKGALLQVATVDAGQRQVTLREVPHSQVGTDPTRHPLLRRWDYRRSQDATPPEPDDGALAVVEESKGERAGGEEQEVWLDLEEGIQISFQRAVDTPHFYRSGDYWLIPARTVTGDVEWPQAAAKDGQPPVPAPLPPLGVEHGYAPLALVQSARGAPVDLRSRFSHLKLRSS